MKSGRKDFKLFTIICFQVRPLKKPELPNVMQKIFGEYHAFVMAV
jgi:hypothetical protein